MYFVSLKQRPEFFDTIMTLFYAEWHSVFEKTGLSSIDDVKTHYRSRSKASIFLAIEKDKLLGCYSLLISNDKMFLCDVIVVPKYRHTGVGSRLVADAIDRSKQMGWNVMYLYAFKNMISFYKKHGFVTTSKTKKNEYLMVRDTTHQITSTYFLLIWFVCVTMVIIWMMF